MSKTIEELTIKEIFEDIDYYLNYAQMQSPSFVDKTLKAIKIYIVELKKRGVNRG